MKPLYEHVTVQPGESWALQWKHADQIPFWWHYHPEFELTLVMNTHGHRYVADSIEPFESGDLVLIGPNQPHSWASDGNARIPENERALAVVAWFTGDWLDRAQAQWPEMQALQWLRSAASRGVRFSPPVRDRAQPLMLSLGAADPALRLGLLLQILAVLSADDNATLLSSTQPAPVTQQQDRKRLSAVLERIHGNLREVPNIGQLAALAALSVGAFHRHFKRHTGMTVVDYVSMLRVGAACQQLISTDRPVASIATEVGFGNLSNFNRRFLRSKGLTPTRFRKAYRGTKPR